jgi:hypothetical protein
MSMETTIAVSVTFKVNAEGHTADELVDQALQIAMSCANSGSNRILGVSVEGATALVNREALDSYFN